MNLMIYGTPMYDVKNINMMENNDRYNTYEVSFNAKVFLKKELKNVKVICHRMKFVPMEFVISHNQPIPSIEFVIPEEANGLDRLDNKKGKWLEEDGFKYCSYDELWKCSECGFISTSKMNFCGGCGADMRG